MLFHSSLRRELARSFLAMLVVLVTIVMTMILIRTLGQASRGRVDPSEVTLVMGYTVLGHLPTILTLSIFVAVVGTLSRLYRDSEMAVWFASGRGIGHFLRPMLSFAWPILLAVTLLALFAWPWSNARIEDLKDRFENRGDLERIAPGKFQESAGGRRVFFIDKDSPDAHTGSSVFIYASERGRDVVTSARTGHIEIRPQGRFLLLEHGQQVEYQKNSGQVKISDFSGYEIQVGEDQAQATQAAPPKSLSTRELLRDGSTAAQGELAWRFGLALAALNLLLLAVLVSSSSPRAGRGAHLLLALMTFVVYYNLITLGQSWIVAGRYGLGQVLLLVHGGLFLAACVGLWWRHVGASLWLPHWRIWPFGRA